MPQHGMIRLEPSHFSNVIGAVQRTASLTGGAVRGLPGGVVVGGLVGVNSFAASISDAQKEYQLGRSRTSLERIRQLENEFNGIVSRWNSTVMSLIANARHGRQGLPIQKLNEIKNAQTRMQQMTGPANKAFRDLLTALEFEITMEGHEPLPGDDDEDSEDSHDEKSTAQSSSPGEGELSDADAFDAFASAFTRGPQLKLKRAANKKVHVVPQLAEQAFYFVAGSDPPRVVQIRRLQKASIDVIDATTSEETQIGARELWALIKQGIWLVEPKTVG